MKATNVMLALLLGLLLGVMLGASGLHQLTQEEGAKLREQIKQREQRIDSLRATTLLLTDSLRAAQKVTTIEIIKYEKIKPRSFTVPSLDSLFRARYER